MFKKAFSPKTSTSLRNSDCRKLRASVAAQFLPADAQPVDAESLVPDGLKSAKFLTSQDEPGVGTLAGIVFSSVQSTRLIHRCCICRLKGSHYGSR